MMSFLKRLRQPKSIVNRVHRCPLSTPSDVKDSRPSFLILYSLLANILISNTDILESVRLTGFYLAI